MQKQNTWLSNELKTKTDELVQLRKEKVIKSLPILTPAFFTPLHQLTFPGSRFWKSYMGSCLQAAVQMSCGQNHYYCSFEFIKFCIFVPYLFGYKPTSAISRDPKLLTQKINLIDLN